MSYGRANSLLVLQLLALTLDDARLCFGPLPLFGLFRPRQPLCIGGARGATLVGKCDGFGSRGANRLPRDEGCASN